MHATMLLHVCVHVTTSMYVRIYPESKNFQGMGNDECFRDAIHLFLQLVSVLSGF